MMRDLIAATVPWALPPLLAAAAAWLDPHPRWSTRDRLGAAIVFAGALWAGFGVASVL